MRSKYDRTIATLRGRYARALGISSAAFVSVTGCASAEKDFVAAPMSPPPIDAGLDAADNEASVDASSVEDGGRHATRMLHEPANRDRCTRVVRCRPEDDDVMALPYPDPFSHCAPTFSKSEHDAQFSPKETKSARGDGEGVCCYVEFKDCRIQTQIMRGRALRIAGNIHASEIAFHPDFSRKNVRPHSPPRSADACARLAARWTRDASLEHASIASFERLAFALTALHADDALIAACHRAARDETKHTSDACALASAYAGRDVAPLPTTHALDADLPDLATLARETLLDGCIGETVATLVATRELAGCEDAGVARVLARVARDEARHAELAFRILAWAVNQGGASLTRHIAHALADLTRDSLHGSDASNLDAGEDSLAMHGELSAREHADIRARALAEVVTPLVLAITQASADKMKNAACSYEQPHFSA